MHILLSDWISFALFPHVYHMASYVKTHLNYRYGDNSVSFLIPIPTPELCVLADSKYLSTTSRSTAYLNSCIQRTLCGCSVRDLLEVKLVPCCLYILATFIPHISDRCTGCCRVLFLMNKSIMWYQIRLDQVHVYLPKPNPEF